MKFRIAWAMAALISGAPPGIAAEISVMSGGAPKEVLATLIPQFQTLTGHHVHVTYAVITALQQKLQAGETPDMVLLPTTAIVKEGAPRPDISTPDAFRDALLKARSLVYSPPTTPSGMHLARLVEQLGIAPAIKDKVTYRSALDGGAEVVASGGAEIGIYQSSEVVHVKDVTEIGPLPDALQLKLVYGGAVSAANANPQPALSFIKFLAEPENK